MADPTEQTALERLQTFAATFSEIEKEEQAGAYVAFFTIDMAERLAEHWDENSFAIETLMGSIGTVRGFSTRCKQMVASIKRAARRARAQAQEDIIDRINQQDVFATSLPEYLTEDLPNYLIPGGFEVDLGGVYTVTTTDDGEGVRREKQCSAPIIITQRGRDAETGHMQVEVAWVEPPGPGRGHPTWRHRTVERSVLFDAMKLKGLINYGIPVTSVNANEVVKWLTAFEDVNQHLIPLTNGSSRLGWQHDGSFLLPDGHYRTEHQHELKLFPSEGMESIVKSLRTGGSWEGWLQVVESVRDHPLAMLSIYTAAVAPLLEVFRCPNFAVDWSNQTSSGKTTALRLGASVWGYPVDDDDEGFIYSWDSTKVWAERAAGFLHSLPLLLDETKRVKDKQHIADILYDFCSGKGRGRGTLQGVERSNTWKSVLMSTGEQRLTSFTGDGGTRARVLALQGAPIEGPPATARPLAESVRGRLYTHYGHLGRKLVRYLVYYHDQRETLREIYEERKIAYGSVTTSAVGGRLASYVAALDVAQGICESLGVPAPTKDPIQFLVQAIRSGADDSDRARDAFIAAVSWANMNRHRFLGTQAAARSNNPGAGGWAGRWKDMTPWKYIAIEAKTLSYILERYGYIYEEVVPQWSARNWIAKTTRGVTKSISIEGLSTPCVCPLRDVYDELLAKHHLDIDPVTVLDAQEDLFDETITTSDSTWSARGADI